MEVITVSSKKYLKDEKEPKFNKQLFPKKK